MAFNEGLKQKIDLLGALQARRQMEQTAEQRKQQELQNQLMQEQLKAAEWQNLKDRERQTITLPAGPGLGGMREKQFLDQQAGYISGVSPTDVFNQWNQNFRTGMTAGGGGGGVRMPSEDESRLLGAQADIAEEQARQEQYKRQGYGSANAGLAAQRQLDTAISEAEKNRQTQVDVANIYGGAKESVAEAQQAGDIIEKLIGASGKNSGYTIDDVAATDEFRSLPPIVKEYFMKNSDGIKKAMGNKIADLPGFIRELKEQYTKDYMDKL